MCEILAPAGDEKSAYAAINSGADAIYLGLTAFSARSGAENFCFDSLEKLIARAHFFGVKIYVAMNTLVSDSELSEFIGSAVRVHNLGADAIIIQDIYLGAYLKKTYPQMCLHLSTQAGICNVYGAEYAKELGFSRVILARETPICDVKKIAGIIETEVFVQGALCTCFSGQCYLSSFVGGNSGNRGKCKQPCRKRYKLNRKGFTDYAYRLSLADLCVGEDVGKLADAGVSSFKIEGRMRRAEYVSAAVQYYKGILNSCGQKDDFSALKRTYNRGNYTKGLAFGQEKNFISSAVQGHMGEYLGAVSVENGKYLCRTALRCGEGDGFKILRDGKELCGAVCGGTVKGAAVIKSSVRLKNGDKVFITTDCGLNRRLLDKKRTAALELSIEIASGKTPCVTVCGVKFTADFTAEIAKGRPIRREDIVTCFDKVDAYPYSPVYKQISVGGDAFVPMSLLNAFRRKVYADYFAMRSEKKLARIESVAPVPHRVDGGKNHRICVVAETLNGVSADIGVLKPNDYGKDLNRLVSGFKGEKFLYLPPFASGDDIEVIKPQISLFDGIYCGGNYAVTLCRELGVKLFAGVGFNLFNRISVSGCPAEYIALSKELTANRAERLSSDNTFYLTAGDIKVMDLVYCPFEKSCGSCDKKNLYVLTDENGREFSLRRYEVSQCRFELFNCDRLVSENKFTGVIYDLTTLSEDEAAAFGNAESLPDCFKNYTRGHTKSPVL